jgi:hypothetical protein
MQLSFDSAGGGLSESLQMVETHFVAIDLMLPQILYLYFISSKTLNLYGLFPPPLPTDL